MVEKTFNRPPAIPGLLPRLMSIATRFGYWCTGPNFDPISNHTYPLAMSVRPSLLSHHAAEARHSMLWHPILRLCRLDFLKHAIVCRSPFDVHGFSNTLLDPSNATQAMTWWCQNHLSTA
uniref:Uncharacterized protein n=1 Tax=Eutreptiella gymnastica TaxID=73025 RepID=A0A7S1IGW4_9EUGL